MLINFAKLSLLRHDVIEGTTVCLAEAKGNKLVCNPEMSRPRAAAYPVRQPLLLQCSQPGAWLPDGCCFFEERSHGSQWLLHVLDAGKWRPSLLGWRPSLLGRGAERPFS